MVKYLLLIIALALASTAEAAPRQFLLPGRQAAFNAGVRANARANANFGVHRIGFNRGFAHPAFGFNRFNARFGVPFNAGLYGGYGVNSFGVPFNGYGAGFSAPLGVYGNFGVPGTFGYGAAPGVCY